MLQWREKHVQKVRLFELKLVHFSFLIILLLNSIPKCISIIFLSSIIATIRNILNYFVYRMKYLVANNNIRVSNSMKYLKFLNEFLYLMFAVNIRTWRNFVTFSKVSNVWCSSNKIILQILTHIFIPFRKVESVILVIDNKFSTLYRMFIVCEVLHGYLKMLYRVYPEVK